MSEFIRQDNVGASTADIDSPYNHKAKYVDHINVDLDSAMMQVDDSPTRVNIMTLGRNTTQNSEADNKTAKFISLQNSAETMPAVQQQSKVRQYVD